MRDNRCHISDEDRAKLRRGECLVKTFVIDRRDPTQTPEHLANHLGITEEAAARLMLDTEIARERERKPRIRLEGGIWVCSAKHVGFGWTPLEAYRHWRVAASILGANRRQLEKQ